MTPTPPNDGGKQLPERAAKLAQGILPADYRPPNELVERFELNFCAERPDTTWTTVEVYRYFKPFVDALEAAQEQLAIVTEQRDNHLNRLLKERREWTDAVEAAEESLEAALARERGLRKELADAVASMDAEARIAEAAEAREKGLREALEAVKAEVADFFGEECDCYPEDSAICFRHRVEPFLTAHPPLERSEKDRL